MGKPVSGAFDTETTEETGMIPGLTHIPDYISASDEELLLKAIDERPWLSELRRRVQHYGYKYDYKSRNIDTTMKIGPLPDFTNLLKAKMLRDGYFEKEPDQLIINEYEPGQGISTHVDCEPCFGEHIASVSLGSGCMMTFIKGTEPHEIYLEPRCVLALTGPARYEWKHGILARKSDGKRDRGRRVSLTFRKVILEEKA
jgi:alkylated DNA repair dioxygenase AlkB